MFGCANSSVASAWAQDGRRGEARHRPARGPASPRCGTSVRDGGAPPRPGRGRPARWAGRVRPHEVNDRSASCRIPPPCGAGRRRLRTGPRHRRPVGPSPPRPGRPGGGIPMGTASRSASAACRSRSSPSWVGWTRSSSFSTWSRAAATSNSRYVAGAPGCGAEEIVVRPGPGPLRGPAGRSRPAISTSGPLPVAAGLTWETTEIHADAATRSEATAALVRGTSRSARSTVRPSPLSGRQFQVVGGDVDHLIWRYPRVESPEAARAASTPSIAAASCAGRELHQVPQRGPGPAVPLVPPQRGLGRPCARPRGWTVIEVTTDGRPFPGAHPRDPDAPCTRSGRPSSPLTTASIRSGRTVGSRGRPPPPGVDGTGGRCQAARSAS